MQNLEPLQLVPPLRSPSDSYSQSSLRSTAGGGGREASWREPGSLDDTVLRDHLLAQMFLRDVDRLHLFKPSYFYLCLNDPIYELY